MKALFIHQRKCEDITCWRYPAAVLACGLVPAAISIKSKLPARIISHSPDGFEWGYGGSGPADFALNICAACLPVGCDHLPAVKLFQGECSQVAWDLHQQFKEHFIAPLPRRGGQINGDQVDEWLAERVGRWAMQNLDWIEESQRFLERPADQGVTHPHQQKGTQA